MRPRGFVLFLIAGALVLALTRCLGGADTAAAPAPPPSPTSAAPTPSAPASVTPSPTTGPTGADDHEHDVDRAWLPHVEAFVTAYTAAARTPAAQWRQQMARLATPSLAEGLAYTDPAVVPTGKPVATEVVTDDYSGGGVARVDLDDGTALLVTVVLDATGAPKAASIEPVS